MVDFRPLLFINALAIMLLVTAGFASVRDDLLPNGPSTVEKAVRTTAEPATNEPESVPTETAQATDTEQNKPPTIKPFSIPDLPENPTIVAMAEPVSAIPEPKPPVPAPRPKTGQLTLRSNVVGDTVTVNGKEYGATRLDLELEPGKYQVVISKEGYKPWSRNVALDAGSDLTLVGRLEAYTKVDYRGGVWIGGVKTGDGTYTDTNGLRYEGSFVDGKFHGKGTAWYADGGRYEGDWKEGRREGEGLYQDADSTRYTGQFKDDQFHGQGTLTAAGGDILTGQWEDGRLNGHGSLTTSDGMLYVGGFRNDRFHGEGSLTYPDGRHYEGEFSNGEFHGKGSEVFASGKKYDGQYVEGKFHGKGRLLNPNGSSIEATFRHGEPYGKVRLTTAAGEVFTARTSEPGVCYRDKSYRATQCPQLEGW